MEKKKKAKKEMYDDLIKAVDWLEEKNLPVAIVLTETLQPSEGKDAIIFPPTYAVKKAPHPYQIDVMRQDITPQQAKPGEEVNNCLIDSVGSQANRMESCFKMPSLSMLVPQVEIKLKVKGEEDQVVNLLDVGHRIADGAVRFSGLRDDVTNAITKMRDEANAFELAQLAPTSLLFGFWDSRPETTMFKHARIISSTIRATNVSVITRSAQFNPAFDPAKIGRADEVTDETETAQPDEEDTGKAGDGKDPMSKLGLRSAPAVGTHGGVRVYGQIIRRTQINLVALRALAATTKKDNAIVIDKEKTMKLRRYILGLALTASQVQQNYALREGCMLVRTGAPQLNLIYTDPSEKSKTTYDFNFDTILSFTKQAAADFGVKSDTRKFEFKPEEAKKAIGLKPKGKGKSKK